MEKKIVIEISDDDLNVVGNGVTIYEIPGLLLLAKKIVEHKIAES